jgi:PRTRC genetic system ThiF family protein
VFDPDTVTEANVGRQLFSPSDIGAHKASVLVNRVNLFFNLDWNASPTLYRAGTRWGDTRADILIGCVDSAAARRELAKTRFKYWLDLGNTDKKGQVILGTRIRSKTINRFEEEMQKKKDRLSPDERVSMRKTFDRHKRMGKNSPFAYTPPRPRLVTELFPELKDKRRKEETAPSCSLAEALQRQDLFINQTVATFALQLLWQFIRQGGLDIHGYFINLESGKVTPLPIK